MIYYFDVDNTVCHTVGDNYANATPIEDRIDTINQLFDEGHKIVMWTARGALSGNDWLHYTKEQLDMWGLRYHELIPKPYFDCAVDDKALSDKEFFK